MARKERLPVRSKMWREATQKLVDAALDAMVANGYAVTARYADDESVAAQLKAHDVKFDGFNRTRDWQGQPCKPVSDAELGQYINIWRAAHKVTL